MQGWRQWQLGGRNNLVRRNNKRITLTPTGLLMEGVYTNYEDDLGSSGFNLKWHFSIMSVS
jgi:hypothetical protein